MYKSIFEFNVGYDKNDSLSMIYRLCTWKDAFWN